MMPGASLILGNAAAAAVFVADDEVGPRSRLLRPTLGEARPEIFGLLRAEALARRRADALPGGDKRSSAVALRILPLARGDT